jgi:hypothetical protein
MSPTLIFFPWWWLVCFCGMIANVPCTISRLLPVFRKAGCCGCGTPAPAERIDAYRIGFYNARSDDVDGNKEPVAASRPVTSRRGGKFRSNLRGRRPTPWPDVNPDQKSMDRLLARHRANATQSSEEGDIAEPLPSPRERPSRSKPDRTLDSLATQQEAIVTRP